MVDEHSLLKRPLSVRFAFGLLNSRGHSGLAFYSLFWVSLWDHVWAILYGKVAVGAFFF